MELITSQLFGAHLLGRATEVLGKLLYRSDVATDRIGGIVPPPEIVQHALTQSGHRNLLPMTTQASPARTSFATPLIFRRRASDLVLTGYPDRTEGGTSDHGLVARRPQTMKQPRSRVNCKKAKTVLRLPDLEHAKTAVLNSLTSADAQRGYRRAIDEFR